MPIVITTPTGNIGRYVVNQLLQAGESLRLIARYPDKLDSAIAAQTEVIQGSIDDVEILTQAFEGADSVFWCVPQSHTQPDVLDYYLHFAKAAATAIQQTKVPQVVAVSSGGKGLAKNAGAISALHAMEAVLDTTSSATRYLRCGNFMENFLWQIEPMVNQGVFFYPIPSDFAMPMVATRDIAMVAAKWLVDRTWSGQEGIGVHGAEDLSCNQAAEIFSQVLSKPVRFQSVPAEAYRQSMLNHGASPAFAQSLLDMFVEVASGIYNAEPRTPETTTPVTLNQWAEETMLSRIDRRSSQSV
jgi:uncharacterized protein YbjT (DUF2867 family)